MFPKGLTIFILCTILFSGADAQSRLTSPLPRINADITTNVAGSYCGSLTQSVQGTPGLGNVYYIGDTFTLSYRLQTATVANVDIGLIQYSSAGTATTLPNVANVYPITSVTSTQATTTPATVSGLAVPNVVCLNPGDCAITWHYSGATNYYSCADVYIISRANDASVTFHVNAGQTAVPSAATLIQRFLNYFNGIYGTFRAYNVRGPTTDPVVDGGGNYVVTYTMSDGPIGWVNAQNMSYQVQYELANNGNALTVSLFGTGASITAVDVNDNNTRANAPSTTNTAVAVIVVFLILIAILLGVWYYYWKYQPAKLRAFMERACPCFLSGSSGSSATKSSSYMTSSAQPTPNAPGRPPTSAPPNRAQINI